MTAAHYGNDKAAQKANKIAASTQSRMCKTALLSCPDIEPPSMRDWQVVRTSARRCGSPSINTGELLDGTCTCSSPTLGREPTTPYRHIQGTGIKLSVMAIT